MTKTAAVQRDANRIKTLAQELLDDAELLGSLGPTLYGPDKAKLKEIVELSGGLDASTGKRDSSTKSRRSRAAKKGLAGAGRKRVTR